MRGRLLACLALAGLSACAAAPPPGEITSVRFGAVILPKGVARSNLDLGEDLLDLTFALESGEKLDHLLRYETPVRVYLRSPDLAAYRPDLTALLARLRAEAGIDIAETDDAEAAQIQIEAVPAAQISRVFPTAACFIVPGETDWSGFLRRRSAARMRWSDQRTLGRAAIFLPLDTTPQDVRDCLNEEITQALGPANDLYRLPDSIWNDDNFYGMATPFDMTDPAGDLPARDHSGMSRAEVAAVLPRVLDRVNPKGRGLPRQPRQPESRAWATAIEAALSRDAPRQKRLAAATQATQIAAEMRPIDHRLGVSLLTLGRLSLRTRPRGGRAATSQPPTISSTSASAPMISAPPRPGFTSRRWRSAPASTRPRSSSPTATPPAAIAGQNAILLAGLLSIKAEALAELGDTRQAQAVRLDSLRWARYGFGDTDGALAREEAQLAALLRLDKG